MYKYSCMWKRLPASSYGPFRPGRSPTSAFMVPLLPNQQALSRKKSVSGQMPIGYG